MYMLEGVSSVANFITAYEGSQYNRDSHFLICSVFPKAIFLTFIKVSPTSKRFQILYLFSHEHFLSFSFFFFFCTRSAFLLRNDNLFTCITIC